MTTCGDVELCVCGGTLACLAVALCAAGDVAEEWVVAAEEPTSVVAGEAAWQAARDAVGYVLVGDIARDELWDSAWEATGKEAKKVASNAISKMLSEGKDDWQAVGIETARATLHYVITNEEVIYSAISSALPRAAIVATCNHEDVITRILTSP